MQKLSASVLIIFVVVLLISTTAQCASWVLIAEDKISKKYCDNDSIEKSSLFGTRKVWIRTEYKSGFGDTYYMEYNCRNKKVRFVESKESWKLIPPGSVDETIMDYVCK